MNRIYYVGYDAEHPEDFIYDVPNGFHNYLFVVTTTAARFHIDGNITEYPAHTAILYPPDHAIWYGAAETAYGNHWIRFDSDESFVTAFPQMAIPFPVSDPEYCHNLFQLLTWESSPLTSTSRSWQNTGIITRERDENLQQRCMDPLQTDFIISQLLRILFVKLRNDLLNMSGSCHDHALLALRRKIATTPQYPWNLSDMAAQLHISTGHLQLLYKQKFHISCMDDVISFRIFKARDLLSCTTHSIAEIAEQCGYNNTEHFCRQFRKNTGISPGQYRKNNLAWKPKKEN